MIKRIIDISIQNVRLSSFSELLVIESSNKVTVPFAEISALIVSSPAVNYTHAVLAKLAEYGCIFVCCDTKHMPIGMLLPLVAHSVQTQRFAKQILATLPFKKQLWKKIIAKKIEAQGYLLLNRREEHFGLLDLCKKVKSGDEGNLEAQAAIIYWKNICKNKQFKRDITAENENMFLNYGYAVLRAVVARSLCACGLNPSIGVFHKGKYNPFCLADDLMEPFRPIIDREVFLIVEAENFTENKLTQDIKQRLIAVLYKKFTVDQEERQLQDIITLSAQSLSKAFVTGQVSLFLPNLIK
ncbi:type II CRISPR-associated endonuclease Cas1 [Spirobacillus cienkowskii]|uniref:type II CRISPR-associated endonuclease Cas1 n=1 Tax=Spirobacillus cienkowskii TaxID=495820 RepID=UPI0030CD0A6B